MTSGSSSSPDDEDWRREPRTELWSVLYAARRAADEVVHLLVLSAAYRQSGVRLRQELRVAKLPTPARARNAKVPRPSEADFKRARELIKVIEAILEAAVVARLPGGAPFVPLCNAANAMAAQLLRAYPLLDDYAGLLRAANAVARLRWTPDS